MKWIIKWLLRLFIAAVALVVVAVIVLLLTYNSILRLAMERQIRAQTGMDAEIGSVHLALTSPTLEIQNLNIHNPPDFGGTPFLDIPEIHAEYDRAALARREIHLKLLRVNLGELDIVKNTTGQMNLSGLGLSNQISAIVRAIPTDGPTQSQTSTEQLSKQLADFKKQTGLDFTGIDMLNVSIGKVKFIDLDNQQNNREQTIGIDNLVIPNVKSPADLMGLAADIALHSDGFFDSLVDQKKPGLGVLKQLGL